MTSFEEINDRIVYAKIKSVGEITNLKKEIAELNVKGKTVVLLLGRKQSLHLAPGHDPYQIRKDINIGLEKISLDKKVYMPKSIRASVTKTKKSKKAIRAIKENRASSFEIKSETI